MLDLTIHIHEPREGKIQMETLVKNTVVTLLGVTCLSSLTICGLQGLLRGQRYLKLFA